MRGSLSKEGKIVNQRSVVSDDLLCVSVQASVSEMTFSCIGTGLFVVHKVSSGRT